MCVFPTCVGMNRYDVWFTDHLGSVPHMRGDEPEVKKWNGLEEMCSPHAWG